VNDEVKKPPAKKQVVIVGTIGHLSAVSLTRSVQIHNAILLAIRENPRLMEPIVVSKAVEPMPVDHS